MRTITTSDQHDAEAGFTLLELIVVIAITAILAAVAIPLFFSQRENAYLAEARSDLRHAALAAQSFAVTASDDLSGLDVEALEEYGFAPSTDVEVHVAAVSAGYTITATSTALDPSRALTYSSVTGAISGS